MAIDPSKLLFDVTQEGEVRLCYGNVFVTVCDDPHDFEDFKDALVQQLLNISAEISEEYLNGD